MKTFYKKALIIGGASLLLEAIIVYFLYTSINAFYSDLRKKLAYLLVEQVKNVIVAEKIDLSQFSPYNKYPTRRLMNRFSGENSKILHILLIDTTNHIVVSDDPSVEGKVYTSPREMALLSTQQPTVINSEWADNVEIMDVIYPLIQSGVKQGYLRTVISVKHLENFYQNRKLILIFASIFSLGIIMLTVFLTSRIYQGNLRNIQHAIDRLHKSDYQYRLDYQKRDEFAPLFARLNQLFEHTLDLNESFRKSEERVSAMMRVIHEGLLIVDNDYKIVTYNDYLLDILKISRRDHQGDQIYRILQENPKLLEIYRRARDPLTHAVRKVMSLKLPDNSTIDIQINALSILESEQTKGVIFYIKNLALLKELEQNLNRSMKYTVISQLASSIGHEIRNPLSSLAIHTEILDDLTKQLSNEKQHQQKIKKSITILHSEIGRLTKLIDQFFNLAKTREAGLNYEDINIVIEEVMELVQQEAYEKSVNLRKNLGQNLPLINLSHDQMKQVILNIILNAFDAMPEGGDLFLETREFENKVLIRIRDTGNGIPTAVQDKIFDLYFSTKSDGGGIGLAISKKIIEAHEGTVYFQTKIGDGTTFIIELPRF